MKYKHAPKNNQCDDCWLNTRGGNRSKCDMHECLDLIQEVSDLRRRLARSLKIQRQIEWEQSGGVGRECCPFKYTCEEERAELRAKRGAR